MPDPAPAPDADALFDLAPGAASGRFHLRVTEDLCVGPPGNVFLFGGAGLAAAIAAIRRVVGKELIWSTAQFVAPARPGAVLDIDVEMLQAGRNFSQATAVAGVDGTRILTVTAASGARDGRSARQWAKPPAMPPPDACLPTAVWPAQGASFIDRLDVRGAPAGHALAAGDDGALALWLRLAVERAVDAETLALFADFIPAGVGAMTGITGGGNSLDNTLRICTLVPTRWVLANVQLHAIQRGIAHGDVRLFAEDGTLLAIGSQSLIVRTLPG